MTCCLLSTFKEISGDYDSIVKLIKTFKNIVCWNVHVCEIASIDGLENSRITVSKHLFYLSDNEKKIDRLMVNYFYYKFVVRCLSFISFFLQTFLKSKILHL